MFLERPRHKNITGSSLAISSKVNYILTLSQPLDELLSSFDNLDVSQWCQVERLRACTAQESPINNITKLHALLGILFV